MTREAFWFKWFWYAMAVVPVWLLEDLVFSRFSFFGTRPVLFPLVVVAVAVLEGSAGGAGFGLAVGLWWASALPGSGTAVILGSTLAGLLSGLTAQYRLRQSCAGCLFCSFLVLCVMSLTRTAHHFLAGKAGLGALLSIALPEILVSLVFAAPVYLLFRLVYDRVGGDKLV